MLFGELLNSIEGEYTMHDDDDDMGELSEDFYVGLYHGILQQVDETAHIFFSVFRCSFIFLSTHFDMPEDEVETLFLNAGLIDENHVPTEKAIDDRFAVLDESGCPMWTVTAALFIKYSLGLRDAKAQAQPQNQPTKEKVEISSWGAPKGVN